MQNPSGTTLNIAGAERILAAGGVVAIPTETVYGLAARIDREDGLRRIFELKERPFFDPLIVHVASEAELSAVVREWPPAAAALARKFWPGPLTLVLPKNPGLSALITAGLDSVGVRMPDNELALELIRAAGAPLAAPSANKFKKTSPTRPEHVLRDFPGMPILGDGPSKIGIESTVARVVTEAGRVRIEILRPGMVSPENIELCLAGAGIAASIVRVEKSALSPGTMDEHYRPRKPLFIWDSGTGEIPASVRGLRAAALELGDDPRLAARILYSELHRLSDDADVGCIVVREKGAPREGDWAAIWDRLERAASGRF